VRRRGTPIGVTRTRDPSFGDLLMSPVPGAAAEQGVPRAASGQLDAKRVVIRTIVSCMTMLSFRVSDEDAAEIQRGQTLSGSTARRSSVMPCIGTWSS
jgi:hypothetical protein